MKCSRIHELLPLFVGGDLDEARATEVERHVLSCDSCAAEREVCEESRQSLFALKGEPRPSAPDLWPGVRLRLGPPPRRRSAFPVPLRAAAALLVAVVGSLLVVSALPGDPEVEPPHIVAEEDSVPAEVVPEEFMLAEVSPGMDGTANGFGAGELPSVGPAEPERTGWDEF